MPSVSKHVKVLKIYFLLNHLIKKLITVTIKKHRKYGILFAMEEINYMKIARISILYSLLCVLFSVQAMENTQEKLSPEEQAEIDVTIREIPTILEEANYKEIVNKEEQRQAKQEKKKEQAQDEKIKWQNTLLWATAVSSSRFIPQFGIYKKDAVEGSFFAANIVSDIFLYKRIHNNRIAKISSLIKTNYLQMLDELEKVQKSQEAFEKEYDEKSMLGKMLVNQRRKKNSLANPLRNYIQQHHSLIKYNPFKQETIVPLIVRFGVEKATTLLKNKFIEEVSIWDNRYGKVYEENAQGELVESDSRPISLLSILKWGQWFSNPFLAFVRERSNSFVSGMKWFNKKYKWGIPECIYTPTGRAVIELIGLGWGVKLFDGGSNALWAEYVVGHMDELKKILQEYKKAKESFKQDSEIKRIEKDIKEYVAKGHDTASFIPARLLRQWWTARNSANARISFLIAFPIACIAGWKAYNFFNSYMNPEQKTA